jgi:hypothetical protein
VPLGEKELRRDLWPEMRKRISAGRVPARFGWLDWAVAGIVGGSVVMFPRLILALLYQL